MWTVCYDPIALHDADSTGFPNFVLMKLAAWHKARGDHVEWFNPLLPYDRVYSSKVFTFTPEDPYLPADTIRGGTGYGLYAALPDEIDMQPPDYSLHPHTGHAIGFLTRGCIRSCAWCVVKHKKKSVRAYRRWEEMKRPDARNMVRMDNNVLACAWGIEPIERMAGENVWVDFNQGLDARLITREIAAKLAALKWYKPLRMSCDTPRMLPDIELATAYLREAGCTPRRYFVYMLVTTDVREAEARALRLVSMGLTPFAQTFRDFQNTLDPNAEQRAFARWVNHKAIFFSTRWPAYFSGTWSKEKVHFGYTT